MNLLIHYSFLLSLLQLCLSELHLCYVSTNLKLIKGSGQHIYMCRRKSVCSKKIQIFHDKIQMFCCECFESIYNVNKVKVISGRSGTVLRLWIRLQKEARGFPHLCWHGMFILCPLSEVLGSEVMALSVGKMGKPWQVLKDEGNNNTC